MTNASDLRSVWCCPISLWCDGDATIQRDVSVLIRSSSSSRRTRSLNLSRHWLHSSSSCHSNCNSSVQDLSTLSRARACLVVEEVRLVRTQECLACKTTVRSTLIQKGCVAFSNFTEWSHLTSISDLELNMDITSDQLWQHLLMLSLISKLMESKLTC